MNNRLIINPLIEENMNQMVDGEFSVNQIKGHITVKKEEEYISKTKEINSEIIDINITSEDLTSKIQDDINKLASFENKLSKELFNKFSNFDSKIKNLEDLYKFTENKSNDLEITFEEVNEGIENLLYEKQKLYSVEFQDNYDYFTNSMIASELLDVIINSNSYFTNFIKSKWYYENPEGEIKGYGTINRHRANKNNIDLLMDEKIYKNAIEAIEGNYKNGPWLFSIRLNGNDVNSSISYDIKG